MKFSLVADLVMRYRLHAGLLITPYAHISGLASANLHQIWTKFFKLRKEIISITLELIT